MVFLLDKTCQFIFHLLVISNLITATEFQDDQHPLIVFAFFSYLEIWLQFRNFNIFSIVSLFGKICNTINHCKNPAQNSPIASAISEFKQSKPNKFGIFNLVKLQSQYFLFNSSANVKVLWFIFLSDVLKKWNLLSN